MNEEELEMKMLGEQLRCPSGVFAKEVGETMFRSNSNMISQTIKALGLRGKEQILELGFGKGEHVKLMFEELTGLDYHGIDISEAMVRLATERNHDLVKAGKTHFSLVKAEPELSFKEGLFDAFFSVNTLYFWDDPAMQFREINRVLKSEGKLAIAFIEKEYGQQLPFTQHGFTFYDKDEVKVLMGKSGFQDISFEDIKEQAVTKEGKKVTRPFVIGRGVKP